MNNKVFKVCFIDIELSWATGTSFVFRKQEIEIGGIFVMGVGARFLDELLAFVNVKQLLV